MNVILIVAAVVVVASCKPSFPLFINFGPKNAPECGSEGSFIEDTGEPFRFHHDNLMKYGWRSAVTPFEPTRAKTALRKTDAKVGCPRKSFAYMQFGDAKKDPNEPDVLWQLSDVPNGYYTVDLIVGDVARTGDVHSVFVNGQKLIQKLQKTETEFLRTTTVVLVSNGRMRFFPMGGRNTKLNRIIIHEGGTPKTGGSLKQVEVNFLPKGETNCGQKFLKDVGEAYGLKKEGYSYGWFTAGTEDELNDGNRYDISDRMVKRKGEDNCLFSSFASMQKAGEPDAEWKIDNLTNGNYKVQVVAGDPQAKGFGSTHYIEANGVRVLRATVPDKPEDRVTGSATVKVSDGTMRISAQKRGKNTKLSAVSLRRTGPFPVPKPEPTPKPRSPPDECIPNPSEFDGALISNLRCEDVAQLPVYRQIGFNGKKAGLVGSDGVSVEWTMFLPTSNRNLAYDHKYLLAKSGEGLQMRTSFGSMKGTANNQLNALGIGLDLPSRSLSLRMTWKLPATLKGKGERACMWFGNSPQKFVWLCVVAQGNKFFIELMVEKDDKQLSRKRVQVNVDENQRLVVLQLQLLSQSSEVVARYRTTGKLKDFASAEVPREYFSFDAANSDFRMLSRSYAGPYVNQGTDKSDTSHRFLMTDFEMREIQFSDDVKNTPGIDFKTTFLKNLNFVTAMAFGPNGKLYTTNAVCDVNVISFKADGITEAKRVTYKPLGERLCLGLEIDPDSTPSNVILWFSHSDSSQDDGQANSGRISRVKGVKLDKVQHVITGLPRAIGNHGPNSLHFGPDGHLYFTIGSNTAGGASNPRSPTFGLRPEQCLAAALLRANVKNKGFNGNCLEPADPVEMDKTGIASEKCNNLCDVEVYASGLRNSYDFTWRNGDLFATENGLGGTGTAPMISDDYKEGDSCNKPVPDGKIDLQDPESTEDLLHKITRGAYYGHPCPPRKECIYMGGFPKAADEIKVPRLPLEENKGGQYTLTTDIYKKRRNPHSKLLPPMLSFGLSRSPNGIIAYKGNQFCGKMKNDLLVTWYSQFDQVRWLHMNSKGGVERDETLRRTSLQAGGLDPLRNPLTLTQNKRGDLFISEFFGMQVRVLRPKGTGCNRQTASRATIHRHVDISGASLGHHIYVFGGQNSDLDAAQTSDVHSFDIVEDKWTTLEAKLPVAARSLAAVNWKDESVFLIGGFNDDMGVSTCARLSLEGQVHEHASMPVPRGGLSAIALGSERILVVGGSEHASLCPSRETYMYNPHAEVWSRGPDMHDERMFAASAYVNGNAIVCGGVGKALTEIQTCESFDGSSWKRIASLPAPLSRAGAVSTGDSLVLKGGETNGKVSREILEYNPQEDAWDTIGTMAVGRSAGIVTKVPGAGIYAMGGRTDVGEAPHADIFEYK
ncbi:hypothetical protein NDN08_002196 [Rhodosorus marinus]|uniref:Glucose/Sorbosone dehydrogenase domain-containing protein n=1 Tax=Rhodosorus marinus TaxID=101924 RepID=A0AAV8UT10_9RHOD|nr:hypothetical protein NDN08_002196 [Rhodosorus marinus]